MHKLKAFLFIPLLLFLVLTPAFGQLLSDATGLVNRLEIKTSGYSFEVLSVSNYDVTDYEFNKDEKRLTIFTISGLENNLGELTIPQELLGGNFTFYLNDVEYNPKVKTNEKISFITLNFNGTGNNKIDIIATETFAVTELKPVIIEPTDNQLEGGGCLIATATYGSELAPQVQQLRELRDNKLLQTKSGTTFMNSFNEFYYSFSPTIADLERKNFVIKEMIRYGITPMLSSLSLLNYVNLDSETKVFGYGLSIILLNIGMYIVTPTVFIIWYKKWKIQKLL